MFECLLVLALTYLLLRFAFFVRKCFYLTLALILFVIGGFRQTLAWIIGMFVTPEKPKCRS